MEQSPWEANSSSASQEIRRILRNPKVHYRIHKCPPPVPILSQINPVHASSCIFNIHLILSPHIHIPYLVQVFCFATQKPSVQLSFPHTCYMPRLSHFSGFCHWTNTWWIEQIMKLLVMYFSPLSFRLVPPRPKYSPQHLSLEHLHPVFLPQCERPSFTPIQNNRQNYSLHIVFF